jgi:hypothetical protein
MFGTLSRAQLTRRLEIAESEIKMLAALVYVARTDITVLNYTATSGGFLYVPTPLMTLKSGETLAVKRASAASYVIPSIRKMYDHVMINIQLVP